MGILCLTITCWHLSDCLCIIEPVLTGPVNYVQLHEQQSGLALTELCSSWGCCYGRLKYDVTPTHGLCDYILERTQTINRFLNDRQQEQNVQYDSYATSEHGKNLKQQTTCRYKQVIKETEIPSEFVWSHTQPVNGKVELPKSSKYTSYLNRVFFCSMKLILCFGLGPSDRSLKSLSGFKKTRLLQVMLSTLLACPAASSPLTELSRHTHTKKKARVLHISVVKAEGPHQPLHGSPHAPPPHLTQTILSSFGLLQTPNGGTGT